MNPYAYTYCDLMYNLSSKTCFFSDFIEIDFLQKFQRHTKLDVLSLLHKNLSYYHCYFHENVKINNTGTLEVT